MTTTTGGQAAGPAADTVRRNGTYLSEPLLILDGTGALISLTTAHVVEKNSKKTSNRQHEQHGEQKKQKTVRKSRRLEGGRATAGDRRELEKRREDRAEASKRAAGAARESA